MIGPFFGLLVGAAWFWICYVTFTQEYKHSWMLMIVWVVLAGTIGAALSILAFEQAVDSELLAELLGRGISYAVLYLVLTFYYQVGEIALKLKILGMHLVGTLLAILVIP